MAIEKLPMLDDEDHIPVQFIDLGPGDVGADPVGTAVAVVVAHVGAADPHGDRSFATSAVATHNADTTGVHGLANTALLETTTGAQAKVDVLSGTVVHTTGAETVGGVKTFSDSPIVPTPTTASQAAPKSYVDAKVPERAYYLDVYNGFFTAANVFATGQGNSTTTLTAQATAGTTTLSVASATGYIVGTVIVLHPGTANWQLVKVSAVSSNDLTVTPAVVTTVNNGTTISPLWTDANHLTSYPYGARAYGYWVANAQISGQYVFTGAGTKVVWLGDSWSAQAVIGFEEALDARLGSSTVINAGISGNRLDQMIARFATDVAPHAPNYVVVEHGVNDVLQFVYPLPLTTYIDQIVALCQAIDAVAVFPGMVPLVTYPAQAAARQIEFKAQLSSPVLPATTMSAVADRFGDPGVIPAIPTSIRLGGYTVQVLAQTAAVNNVGIGYTAQQNLTTGINNVAVGVSAQNKLTTSTHNVAVGKDAQANLTTGANNLALCGNAQLGLTTGSGNTAVGKASQYSPRGVIANATTTATGQTSVGLESGQSSTAQASYITTVGYWSAAEGVYSTAIGSQAVANGSGSVAIGCDSGGAGATTPAATDNQIALGTANHTVTVAGRLLTAASVTGKAGLNIAHGVAPTSPVNGDMWTTTAGLFVRINGATVGPLS